MSCCRCSTTKSERPKKCFVKPSSLSSDSQIVNHGLLVKSPRAPDRVHRGWYPVSKCTQRPLPPAGIKTDKETYFENYHVICKICDLPPKKKKNVCSKCKKKKENESSSRSQPSCSSMSSSEPSKKPHMIPNAHWRQHDPHMWMDKPMICAHSRAHKRNWFYDGIQMEMLDNERRRLRRLEEMSKQAKKGSTVSPNPKCK